MTVSVCEYLGQRADQPAQITPHQNIKETKPSIQCPFKVGRCDKLAKGLQPVCSVRKSASVLWITCEHRLCATTKNQKMVSGDRCIGAPLVLHQKEILKQITHEVYGENQNLSHIGVKREAPIPVEGGNSYHADYVMMDTTNPQGINFVLEMQGGGETTNTGALTRHIESWAASRTPTNGFLSTPITSVGTLETNAWRRQQEQFLIKGNVSTQTGGRIVFAVGSLIYDYIHNRIERSNLRDLKGLGWTLALVSFKEDEQASQNAPVPLIIDPERVLYTNYNTFIRTLTDQGAPCPELFQGDFISII
jgi:hypothetical protein